MSKNYSRVWEGAYPKVSSSQHAQKIHSMFSSIAHRYDMANAIISMGMDRNWRKLCVRWSDAKPGDSILDLATGTGDLAIAFKKKLGPSSKVIGSDYCEPMIAPAKPKAKQLGLEIRFEIADATKLPYQDSSFDVTSISFGLRNVDDRIAAIKEMSRVTKPGGRVMILDTGLPNNPIIRFFYQFYFSKIMPFLGGLLSRQKNAYQYLQDSAQQFPYGEKLKSELLKHGEFEKVSYRSLALGSAYLYRAQKS